MAIEKIVVGESAKQGKPWAKANHKDKRWQVDWTADDKRRRKRFKSEAEALDFELQRQQSIRTGTYVDPKLAQKMTVGKLYEQWIDRVETVGATGGKPASRKTVDNYRRAYLSYIEPRWGTAPVSQVKYDHVAEWIGALTNPAPLPYTATSAGRRVPVPYDSVKRQPGTQPAGARTRQLVASLFGRIMGHGVKLRVLSSNPCKDATGGTDYVPEARVQKEHIYLTMPQLVTLAECAEPYGLFVMLAGTCGLRWGEITALRVSDVTLGDRPTLDINKAYSEVGGIIQEGPTKGGDRRRVPIPPLVAARLEKIVDGSHKDQRLFQSPRGGVLRNSSFRQRQYQPAIQLASERHGDFPRPTFHNLRHTAVSLAISHGANVKVVQRIAGHSSAVMTLDVYAGLFDADLHASASRLNAALAVLGWE
ncbi:tyrosine-type recombinase/integrase [Pseudarthrobacter scleromae]|uniref:tyrosine-type recombinase/integrase n=1 Tax=Pseudarthrobacter scleromae TaxID=158897 RepID=UPI00362CDA77